MPVAQTEMKTVMFFAALMVWIRIRLIWICVSVPFVAFHSQIAGSHLWGMCPHNYSHYALTQSLFIMTSCHVTLGGKWHLIFYLQTISGEPSWLMHVPPGTCVLLKEPPINLWQLPINADCPLITSSLNQPHNICSDKLTELQNDLTSFYMAMYPWLIMGPTSLYVVVLHFLLDILHLFEVVLCLFVVNLFFFCFHCMHRLCELPLTVFQLSRPLKSVSDQIWGEK